jgi:hypothetical protein
VTSLESVGWIANRALRRGGEAKIVASLGASTYVCLGGTLIWIGGAGSARHPRAVSGVDHRHPDALLPVAKPWRPAPPVIRSPPGEIEKRLRLLIGDLDGAKGFGRLLIGKALDPPFDGVAATVGKFADACGGDNPATAESAALALLGLGHGLTPSGDDFIGAALFARGALARGGQADGSWPRVGRRMASVARRRTTTISAALFADMAAGQSFGPLHDLVAALDADDGAAASRSMRHLVGIGSSSGWDMLAGLAVGIAGRAVLRRRRRKRT